MKCQAKIQFYGMKEQCTNEAVYKLTVINRLGITRIKYRCTKHAKIIRHTINYQNKDVVRYGNKKIIYTQELIKGE